MLDWNKNGKIDPIDVGISIAVESEEDKKKSKTEEKTPDIGCLTSFIFVVCLVAVIISFIF